MSQNLQKVNINGKDYDLDVTKAIELGILHKTRKVIKEFHVGDLFRYGEDATRNDLLMLVIQVGIDPADGQQRYALLGSGISGLSPWFLNGNKYALPYNEMIDYLNSSPYTFIKSIGKEFNQFLCRSAESNSKLLEQ